MEATNLAVLAELQEYAQLYFDAIKERNTTDGVCELRPGNYSAKELADREKAACGVYMRPVGDIFDEEVSISVDTFRMRFPYREIFYILARWEAMCRPGKSLKSVFTVGDVEEKTAKVLLYEQTELGKYKAKGMKLQHLTGNWWAPRKLPKCDRVELVYELNGVMFLPGTQAWSDDISNRNSAVLERCAKLDDSKTTEALLNFIATQESAPKFGYFVEVARRAGVDTANTPKSEQPATPTETPRIVRVEIVRDFDKSYYANLYNENGVCHNLSKEYTDFCTLKTLCKKEYGINLPNLSQIEFETYGRKSYAYISIETPQISTQTAEVTNVSTEGGNAENEPQKHISEIMKENNLHGVGYEQTDERRYYDWLYYADLLNYRTIADKALAEALTWIYEAAYRKGKGHIIAMNKDGVLIETVIAAVQATETPQISTETAETVNVSAEGEKAAERAENKPYYTHRWKVLHNCDLKTWDKFHKKHKEAILIFHHGTTYTALQKEAMKVSEMCDIAYKINRHGVEVCQFDDVTLDRIIEQGMYVAIAELPKAPDYGLTEPPQSPEAPPTAKHPTPPPILGRRRRKRARRGAQAAPGLRSAPGMCAGWCGASRSAGRREAPVTSLRGSVGISGMVHGGSFHRGALPRAGPPYTENQALPLQNNFV